MSKKLLPAILLPFLLLTGAAAAQGSEPGDSVVEEWRQVLRYGIDSEVLKVIKAIDQADERGLDGELAELFRQSPSTQLRVAVLDLFEKEKVAAARQTALTLLRQEELLDPELRVALIRYLSALGAEAVRPELERLVEDPSDRIAESAITALGRLGNEASGAGLLQKLQDVAFPDTRKPELILALGKIGYAPAVDPLLAIVADREADRLWRMYAAVSLGEIGDPRAVPALEALFAEQDSLIKVYAATALARFDMKDVEPVLQQGLRDGNVRVRAAAAQALGNPAASASVDFLVYKAKNDPEKQVRLEAIRSLGKIGTRGALAYLRELYRDPAASLLYREEALIALCDNDPAGSVKTITEVLDREWGSREDGAVGFTARKLATTKAPGLAGIFERLLSHPDVTVRIYALRGIGTNHLLGLRGRVEELSTDDPHPAARRIAASVLAGL